MPQPGQVVRGFCDAVRAGRRLLPQFHYRHLYARRGGDGEGRNDARPRGAKRRRGLQQHGTRAAAHECAQRAAAIHVARAPHRRGGTSQSQSRRARPPHGSQGHSQQAHRDDGRREVHRHQPQIQRHIARKGRACAEHHYRRVQRALARREKPDGQKHRRLHQRPSPPSRRATGLPTSSR